MSKNEKLDYIQQELKEEANNGIFINVSQVARVFGFSRDTAAEILVHLDYLPLGKKRLFNIPEVAETIYNMMEGGL